MTDAMELVTEETLDALVKAQTAGILEATGVFSYDLGPLVRLIPVNTPFRNQVPRVASSDGSKFAIWRAYMNVNGSQPRPTPGYEYAGGLVQFSEQDFQAKYVPIAYDGTVSQDAFDTAKGYSDPFADATMGVLNTLLIGEDKVLIGGQSYALPQTAAPVLTASTSGGSIATATIYVGVAARTGSGYYFGGNSRGNSANVAVTGPTGKVTATVATVKGAVAYDWFMSANGSTWFYHSTTTVTSQTFLTLIGSNNPVITAATTQVVPGIYTATPTFNAAADNGSLVLGGDGTPAETDGLIATLTADYNAAGQWVQAGTGTTNPAAFIDGGGAALTLTGGNVAQITNLFVAIWNATYSSPSAIMVNALQANEIANLILSQPSAVTFLSTDASGRGQVTAGGRVADLINVAAGGIAVPLEVHPNVPPGTIIARTDKAPASFPQNGISNLLEVRTLRDYSQFDYAASRLAATANGGPRKDFEIRSVEAFLNRAPVTMGIIQNVA